MNFGQEPPGWRGEPYEHPERVLIWIFIAVPVIALILAAALL